MKQYNHPIEIPVYLTFPCCGTKSFRFVKASGPCSKNFSLIHNKCTRKWGVNITLKWNNRQSKLKVFVKWMEEDPNAYYVKNFPVLRLGEAPVIPPGTGLMEGLS